MRILSRIALGFLCACVCASVSAQAGRKATKVGTASDFATLGQSALPGSVFASLNPPVDEVQQFNAMPNLDAAGNRVPGEFQLNLTVVRGGSPQLLLGVLDTKASPWTFTENTATLLPGVSTVGFASASMTPDLLVFCCDTTSNAQYTVRPNRSSPFPALVDIAGLASPVDPLLVSKDGLETLAYRNISATLIEVDEAEIDRTKYPLPARLQTGSNNFLRPPFLDTHSASVLIDGAGNARAVIHTCDMGGPGSGTRPRPWLSGLAPLDGATGTSRQFHTGPNDDTAMDFPGALAGSTIYPTKPVGGTFAVPKKIDIVASSGATAPAAGGTFRISAWLPYFDRNNPPPVDWAVLVLIGVPGPDITIPGFRGKLALGLTPAFVALPARVWKAETLSADWAVPAPALPAGTVLWTQTLAYDGAGSVNGDTFYFGNTASLQWN